MKKIITISREFGSGGRELGMKLAIELGIPCYDHQIIEMVAQNESISKDYVAKMSEKDLRSFYSAKVGRSFVMLNPDMNKSMKIALAEHKIIKELASQGDCIIVGRASDVVLRDENPFNIFVYADNETKIKRCRKFLQKNEKMTDKEILSMCKKIDKERKAYHEMYSSIDWGHPDSYNLCVNTSNKSIDDIALGLASYINVWYK